MDAKAIANKFARIAAPDPQPNEVRLVQDAEIWAAKLDADVEASIPWLRAAAPGFRWRAARSVWTTNLRAGDGAAVRDQDQFTLRARTESEVLLFDLA